VKAQEAMERVYYNHRIWPKENPGPKPAFESAISPGSIRQKVEAYLKQSSALEFYWAHPLTGDELQAEIDRMGRQTKDPYRLQELFDALNNDPRLIAECLARPLLADRFLRDSYAWDPKLHQPARAQIEALYPGLTPENFRAMGGIMYKDIHYFLKTKEAAPGDPAAMALSEEEFSRMVSSFPEEGNISGTVEGTEAFLVKITYRRMSSEFEGGLITVPKKEFPPGWKKYGRPSAWKFLSPCMTIVVPRSRPTGRGPSTPPRRTPGPFSGTIRPRDTITPRSGPGRK